MIDFREPIIFSILSGIIGFVISVIILVLSKPKIVRTDHTYSIDWFNIIIISLILGIVVAIISFLLKVRQHTMPEIVKMEFSTTY